MMLATGSLAMSQTSSGAIRIGLARSALAKTPLIPLPALGLATPERRAMARQYHSIFRRCEL